MFGQPTHFQEWEAQTGSVPFQRYLLKRGQAKREVFCRRGSIEIYHLQMRESLQNSTERRAGLSSHLRNSGAVYSLIEAKNHGRSSFR